MDKVKLFNSNPFDLGKKACKVCVIVIEFFAQVIRQIYFDLFLIIMDEFNDNRLNFLNQNAFFIIHQFQPSLFKGNVQAIQLFLWNVLPDFSFA